MHEMSVVKRATGMILWILLGLSIANSVYMLAIGFRNVSLDSFAFRQAQTALTAYWLAHGGSWFAYETPVLGAPWTIPFEFPLYQWLVALVSHTGLTITEAGRLISFLFFLATLGPLYSLTNTYRTGIATFLIVAILYTSSPLYVFWARSVMIESAATFLAAAWLALLARLLFRPSYSVLFGALAAGCAATLTKSTTFPAFACVGALLTLHRLYLSSVTDLPFPLRRLAIVLVLGLSPFLVGSLWVEYSERLKATNEIAAPYLSFTALKSWNFGTFDQRMSTQLWHDVVLGRVLPDLLGYGVVPGLLAIGAAFLSRRSLAVALGLTLAFLVPFLITTNLHIVHSYYQVANGVFFIAVVGTGLACLMVQRRYIVALLLLGGIMAGQMAYFHSTYLPRFSTDHQDGPYQQIAVAAKAVTTKRQAIIAFGTDWSSEVPFYAERKGLAVPSWLSGDFASRVLARPGSYLGGLPLGAIVDCFGDGDSPQAIAVRNALKGRPVLSSNGSCRLYGPFTS